MDSTITNNNTENSNNEDIELGNSLDSTSQSTLLEPLIEVSDTNTNTTNSTVPYGFMSPDLISELTYNPSNHPLTPPASLPQFQNLFSENSGNNYSPFIFGANNTTTSSSLSANLTSLPPLNINFPPPITFTQSNLNSFSPEDLGDMEEGIASGIVEDEILEQIQDVDPFEEIESDSEDSNTDSESLTSESVSGHATASTLLRLRRFRDLPRNHFSFGIIWNFENNYDYYMIANTNYYKECRTTRYLSFKTRVNELNAKKNMKLGKCWEINKDLCNVKDNNGISATIKPKYIYFIIYFNNFKGHIDIEYYGLFSEEINEDKAIKQIIELAIYGNTGRLHTTNMTATDGEGFNLYKYELAVAGWA